MYVRTIGPISRPLVTVLVLTSDLLSTGSLICGDAISQGDIMTRARVQLGSCGSFIL